MSKSLKEALQLVLSTTNNEKKFSRLASTTQQDSVPQKNDIENEQRFKRKPECCLDQIRKLPKPNWRSLFLVTVIA